MKQIVWQPRKNPIGKAAMLSIGAAAFVFTAATMLLLPAMELLSPEPAKSIEFRNINTTVWKAQPAPPPEKPRQNTTKKQDIPKQKPRKAINAPQRARNRPKPKLPVKNSFTPALPAPDLALDFNIAQEPVQLPTELPASQPEPPSPEPSEVTPDKVFSTDQLDTQPAVISQIRPIYPFRAKTRGIQGKVNLEFTVFEDGTTGDAAIISSSPPAIFDEAARQAVLKWRFKPGIKNGKPVVSRMKILISFDLVNQ